MRKPKTIGITVWALLLDLLALVSVVDAQSRVALIPTDGPAALPEPIPSALIASLSETKKVQLVERKRVVECLNELRLTAAGLTSGDTAPRLGKLLAADVIVTGEVLPASGDAPGQCLFRVIESRTGIVLRDILLSDVDAKADISPVVRQIVDATATASLPDDKRVYVGVVTVSSEEPGSQLDPVAQSLMAFLEHDLSHTDGVILLERQRIDLLTQEKSLTGLDQQLRSSAILIDAGVRRGKDVQQLVVTLQLHNLTGGNLRSIPFTGPIGDTTALRHGVIAAVLKAIQASPQMRKPVDPATESEDFARRAAHLLANKQKPEAARCSEAALALNSSEKHLALAYDAWNALSSDDTWPPVKNPPVLDELRAGIRAQQIQEVQCRRIIDHHSAGWKMQNIKPFSVALEACRANTILLNPDTPEHKLWRQLKEACLLNYSLALNFTLEAKKPAINFYSQKLQYLPMLAETQIERERLIKDAIHGADAEIDAGRTDDNGLAYFYSQLQFSKWRDGPDKPVDDRAFWRTLTRHREPYVRAYAFQCIMAFGGDDAPGAGVKFFNTFLREAPSDVLHTSRHFQNGASDGLIILAMRQFRPQIDSYFEPFLTGAEKNRDSNALVRWPVVVAELIRPRVGINNDWHNRILRLLDSVPPDPGLNGNAAYLRKLLAEQSAGVERRSRPASVGTGAWSGYSTREIELKNRSAELTNLCGFDLVGDDIVGVWSDWYNVQKDKEQKIHFMAATVPIAGGDMVQIACFDGATPWEFTAISCSKEGVAIAQRDKGVYLLQKNHVDLLTPKDGLPSGEVESAAWLAGILYLGFDGGLAQFDPRSHAFKILCSTRAATPRSILDGGVQYRLAGIIPDLTRRCLWFTVVDKSNPSLENKRDGLWRYDPAADQFTEAIAGEDFGVLQWSGKQIFYSGFPPVLFDTANSKSQKLAGYSKELGWACANDRNCAMFHQDVLFAMSGYLCTPDGHRAEMPSGHPPFDLVATDTNGFVVGDSHSGKLFAIEPNNTNGKP